MHWFEVHKRVARIEEGQCAKLIAEDFKIGSDQYFFNQTFQFRSLREMYNKERTGHTIVLKSPSLSLSDL